MSSAKYSVSVRLRPGVLDIEAEAIHKVLVNQLGCNAVTKVNRIKVFEIELDESKVSGSSLDDYIKNICQKLLVNEVMENFEYKKV